MNGTIVKIKSPNSIQSLLFGITLNLFESHRVFTENLSKNPSVLSSHIPSVLHVDIFQEIFFSRNSVYIPCLHHLKQYTLSIITSKISLP